MHAGTLHGFPVGGSAGRGLRTLGRGCGGEYILRCGDVALEPGGVWHAGLVRVRTTRADQAGRRHPEHGRHRPEACYELP